MKRKLLIVEDDYPEVERFVEDDLPDLAGNWTHEHIASESDFLKRICSIDEDPPDVILMDIMLNWSKGDEPTPEGYEGRWRAGIRCIRELRQSGSTIPVICHTNLEEEDLESSEDESYNRSSHSGTLYINKKERIGTLRELIKTITD